MMIQLATGLDAICKAEIVHRDIKPANIFYKRKPDGTFVWKIGDFGLGISVSGENGSVKSVKGTYIFKSPEMIEGRRVWSKTDVFSLGLVFLEIILPPMDRSDITSLFKKLQRKPRIEKLVKGCLFNCEFNCFQEIIIKMLNHDPMVRLSAENLQTSLQVMDLTSAEANNQIVKYSNESRGPRFGETTHNEIDYEETQSKQMMLQPVTNYVEIREERIELEDWFSNCLTNLVPICGPGGVGKIELFKMFYIMINTTGTVCSWVNGDSLESFTHSIMKIAENLDMPREIYGLRDVSSFIVATIPRKYPGQRWLIAVDNMGEKEHEILQILDLFSILNPFVIYTSKYSSCSCWQEDGVQESLCTQVANTFASTSLSLKADNPKIQYFCQQLSNDPICLKHVSALTIQNLCIVLLCKKYGIPSYLEQLEHEPTKTLQKLRTMFTLFECTDIILNDVNTTVKELRRNHGVRAVQILKFVSYLSAPTIDDLFVLTSSTTTSSNDTSSDSDSDSSISTVKDCIRLLQRYYLVNVANDKIRMHPVVQQITKLWFQNHLKSRRRLK